MDSTAQNFLAVALTAVLGLAGVTVVVKLGAVIWALTAAALRYSIVALILIAVAIFLA